MRYPLNIGSLSWVIHRITGIALSFYLVFHIYFLSHLKEPEVYERLVSFMKNPFVKILELLLFASILFHSFAGIRITLLESGISTKYQKKMAFMGAFIVAILWVAGLFYLL